MKKICFVLTASNGLSYTTLSPAFFLQIILSLRIISPMIMMSQSIISAIKTKWIIWLYLIHLSRLTTKMICRSSMSQPTILLQKTINK